MADAESPRLAEQGRIDAHQHWWSLAARNQPWIDPIAMAAIRRDFDAADLSLALAGTGVQRTVLVQVLNDDAETAELLDQAAAAPVVAGVVGWIDLLAPDAAGRLAGLRASPGGHLLVGVRHQAQAEPDPGRWLAQPGLDLGLAALADAGLPFDLMIRPAQFDVAVDLARRHPGVTFVLDHLGKPPVGAGPIGPWAAGVRALAQCPNVVCKLSGMVTLDRSGWSVDRLRPYAHTVLEEFGAARVMYGSDWPVCLLAARYAEVVDGAERLLADLTADERHLVWRGTAETVYQLDA